MYSCRVAAAPHPATEGGTRMLNMCPVRWEKAVQEVFDSSRKHRVYIRDPYQACERGVG